MSAEKVARGDFTLPGEAGYEGLTLRLAEAWGADTIRDSDGTALSPELLASGKSIYSTICLVRSVNSWAKANPDKLQQSYLMSFPVDAEKSELEIRLLDGFSKDQFRVNFDDDPRRWWQVLDRTTGQEVAATDWSFDAAAGTVLLRSARRRHSYTVDFLAYRLWEEISMYNHVTNGWGERDRLMAVEPAYPETQALLLKYLERWLAEHPATSVVRFTSLFYNFAWFWGDEPELRFVYSDWGSYNMTTNPRLLGLFEAERGYRPKAEDFVDAGRYCDTHNPPSRVYREWMDFVHGFVVDFGRRCVDLVHRAGKKAFVFYDDHWIGVEPYSPRFAEIGFDGIIKCVFSAFEVRLCAGVRGVDTREIRLHPYLFPTGLKGEPTFAPGGDPARDARGYWMVARRALLRAKVDRIGLGGYPSLVEPFPDFIDAIADIADEFRALKALHAAGAPCCAPCRVGILTAWGSLRSWTCSGHLHEHPELDLLRVIEALAGLPFELSFLSFDELRSGGMPPDLDVIVNAGRAGSSWSGGAAWADPRIVEILGDWIASGGGLVGVGEPSALPGATPFFRLASILGVDRETGRSSCRAKRSYAPPTGGHFIAGDFPAGMPRFFRETDEIFVLDGSTEVLAAGESGSPRVAVHPYRKGRAVYLSGFGADAACRRLLHRAIHWAAREEASFSTWTSSSIQVECAYFPRSGTLVAVNCGETEARSRVLGADGRGYDFLLPPYGLEIRPL